MSNTNPNTEAQARELTTANAIKAASDALHRADASEIAAIALHEDFQLASIEHLLPLRRRARGDFTAGDMTSFFDYAKAHAEAGALAMVQKDKMQAVAVLNLGTPLTPGHADNKAIYAPEKTAAYRALQSICDAPLSQTKIAEWIEDWADVAQMQFFAGDEELTTKQAVAAVRAITIESARRVESEEGQLSAARSAFESVQATSRHKLPTTIYYTCEPYLDLEMRLFVLRTAVNTGADAPRLILRMVGKEQHDEAMAQELAAKVHAGLHEHMPVLLGSYQRRND